MRRNRDENSNPWMAYTDLGVALVSLFILYLSVPQEVSDADHPL